MSSHNNTTSRTRRLASFFLTPTPRWWWSTRLWLIGLLALALVIETQLKPFETKNWSSSWTPTIAWNGTEFLITRRDKTGSHWKITGHQSFERKFGRETLTLWTSGLSRQDEPLATPPGEQDFEELDRQLLTQLFIGPMAMMKFDNMLDPQWRKHLEEIASSGGGTLTRWRPDIIAAQLATIAASLGILLWLMIGSARHSQRVYHRSVLRNALRGLCPTCSYDMTKLGHGRCPECGTDFNEPVAAAQSALNVILGDPLD